MTHRGLILSMALAVVASGAMLTRHVLHKRAWRREALRTQSFQFGPYAKPPVDVSLTSESVPM